MNFKFYSKSVNQPQLPCLPPKRQSRVMFLLASECLCPCSNCKTTDQKLMLHTWQADYRPTCYDEPLKWLECDIWPWRSTFRDEIDGSTQGLYFPWTHRSIIL